MIPSNNWTYRGYTMKQLDELIERSERLYQRNGPVTPVEVILPARLTNGMLEQIRAVVREELQTTKKQAAWTPEDEDTFLRGVLRGRLRLGVMSLSEYRAELAKLDKQKTQDTSTDDSSSVVISPVKYYDPEIEGHPSLDAELEHQGKLYKGTLYFVKDVE